MMARRIVIFVILISTCIATEPATARSGKAQPRYDGGWWQTASSGERAGFLYALDDCLTFDEKPVLWFDDTWRHYEQEITQYYSFSVVRRVSSVESIFKRFGKKPQGIAASDASARYGDEFWRAHNDSVHRGFVEGYFACRAKEKNAPKWTRQLDYYLNELDEMYNVNDRHGENAPEYTGSVASALDKMKDQPLQRR